MNISKAAEAYDFSKENFAELFEDFVKKQDVSEGSVIKGEVIAIQKGFALIDVGLKTEGRVPVEEFTAEGGEDALPKIGDLVEVYLERIENQQGYATLSHEKAVRRRAWEKIENTYKEGDSVDGIIFGRVKGGFTVNIGGVVAFLPGSQVDIRPVKDVGPLMNIKQPFQILKIDHRQGNIVVSRRSILEGSREEARNEMLSQIKENMIMDGSVKNITDYGAFIDLGSVDGLLHVTDISWSRISHPSEVLSLGQKVRVKVIKFNEETKRISLGLKQLEENPWHSLKQRYPSGSKFTGKITNITDYGAFVELEPGIEGLVHVSELTWAKGNVHPSKLVTSGQEVEVMVLDIDADKHRISLGIKQCSDNPWQNFANAHPVGTEADGVVKNIVEFGMFVGFKEGVDGLVHVSDLSWEVAPEEAIKQYQVGQEVRVKVLFADVEKERISLGVKQLSADPAGEVMVGLEKGSTVTCVVFDVRDDGIEVSVNDSMRSFIKKNDLARDRVDQRPQRFAVGDKVDAKVVTVDRNNRKLTLSIRALEEDEHKRAVAEFGSSDSGASLGDILGAALSSSSAEKK
jgi:small subunit ribosomal protein S1